MRVAPRPTLTDRYVGPDSDAAKGIAEASPYIEHMSAGEHLGHGLSFTVLVVGGIFAKSAILNWIVGPVLVVVLGCLVHGLESRVAGRRQIK